MVVLNAVVVVDVVLEVDDEAGDEVMAVLERLDVEDGYLLDVVNDWVEVDADAVELQLLVQTVEPEDEAEEDVRDIDELIPAVGSVEVVVEELVHVPPGTIKVCPTSN